MIYQTLCLFSLIENHTQNRKMEAIYAQVSKIGPPRAVFRPYFGPLRTQMTLTFLCVIFDQWYKTKHLMYHFSRHINCADLKNRNFYPLLQLLVLPVFMKYDTAHKRAVEEKDGCGFRLLNKTSHAFKCSFSIFEAQPEF